MLLNFEAVVKPAVASFFILDQHLQEHSSCAVLSVVSEKASSLTLLSKQLSKLYCLHARFYHLKAQTIIICTYVYSIYFPTLTSIH